MSCFPLPIDIVLKASILVSKGNILVEKFVPKIKNNALEQFKGNLYGSGSTLPEFLPSKQQEH